MFLLNMNNKFIDFVYSTEGKTELFYHQSYYF